MIPKLNRNAVLVGKVHSCCLVCGNYFSTEKEANRHISRKGHKTNLQANGYIEEFLNDHIREVKNGYFCEYCNQYISGSTKIRLHILENSHINNKGIRNLERVGNNIVAFKNVTIPKPAWHGIIGHTCLICNVKFGDMEIHISSKEHLFKLVKAEVKFATHKGLYRMVKENSVHCLTCNEVIKTATQIFLSLHFSHPKHKEKYQQLERRDAEPAVRIESPVLQSDRAVDDDTSDDDDEEGEGQYLDEARGYSYDDPLPVGLSDSQEHVVKKVPLHQFVNNIFVIEHYSAANKDVVINKIIVVNVFSFYLVTGTDTLKCQACEIALTFDQIDLHKATAKHEAAMKQIQVILIDAVENEFIREVRTEEFHCGYCNIILQGLDAMVEHLKTLVHKRAKNSASWRLQRHLLRKRLSEFNLTH